jgi:hypothetical protein
VRTSSIFEGNAMITDAQIVTELNRLLPGVPHNARFTHPTGNTWTLIGMNATTGKTATSPVFTNNDRNNLAMADTGVAPNIVPGFSTKFIKPVADGIR